MADRLVEILARHDPDELAAPADLDAALAMSLAERHRVRHRVVGRDEARRPRHDVDRPRSLANGAGKRLEDTGAGVGQRPVEGGRGSLRMSAAAERGGERGRVELGHAAAEHGHDSAVHLDEADEPAGVGEVDELVGEVRDAVDVARPGERADQDVVPGDAHRLERGEQRVEQLALVLRQRLMQVAGDHLLAGPVAEAPGERLGVTEGRARVGQRAGVLVDPEGERGRLERRHGDLALGQDADERRRERAVSRDHGRLRRQPLGEGLAVVVEEHDLDTRSQGARKLAELRRVAQLDEHEPRDLRRDRSGPRRRGRARPHAAARTPARCGSTSPSGRRPRVDRAGGTPASTRTRRSRCSDGRR